MNKFINYFEDLSRSVNFPIQLSFTWKDQRIYGGLHHNYVRFHTNHNCLVMRDNKSFVLKVSTENQPKADFSTITFKFGTVTFAPGTTFCKSCYTRVRIVHTSGVCLLCITK